MHSQWELSKLLKIPFVEGVCPLCRKQEVHHADPRCPQLNTKQSAAPINHSQHICFSFTWILLQVRAFKPAAIVFVHVFNWNFLLTYATKVCQYAKPQQR